jgi:hypothetical protein
MGVPDSTQLHDTDWRGQPIELARSTGGVLAFRNPWDGVVHGHVTPWPPPELVQKLYQSRQVRAYRDSDRVIATAALGYYSDLQSIHSEDAVSWSLLGPLVYATADVRAAFVAQLLELILGLAVTPSPTHIWLWRRLPHPDTLVSGGPEVDFGVQTADTLVLGEAKWRSAVARGQGADGTRDQVQLRAQFCETYGPRLFPAVKQFVVLLVSRKAGTLNSVQRGLSTERVRILEATWEQVGALSAHPCRDEFLAYLDWRQARSR